MHAALGGASDSVSVDLSNTYLEWARDNFTLNKLEQSRHRIVRDDCLRWLETAGSEFDLIFMDPPTFSNSKRMEGTLDIQRDHVRLIELAMARLAPAGELIFSNNQQRFSLDAAVRRPIKSRRSPPRPTIRTSPGAPTCTTASASGTRASRSRTAGSCLTQRVRPAWVFLRCMIERSWFSGRA